MIILGKDSDDKGTQLEKLTQALLIAKQYRNICRNWVGPGGDEIDVRAERVIPTLTATRTLTVICECKAQRTTVDLPQWLKFCGKLFVEQHTKAPDTHGCLVALSGVNGNVRGSFDELEKHNANIELIAGDDLLDLVRQVYSLPDFVSVLERVKAVTDRVCRGSEVVYYDERVYWLLLFEHDAYTVLTGSAMALAAEEMVALRAMIEDVVAAKLYVNLEEEARAKQRSLVAETAVLACLMLSNGTSSSAALVGQQEELTQTDIEKAVGRLLERHIIDGEPTKELRLPENDYKRIAEVFRLLFRAPFPIEVLGCAWYDSHIDRQLVDVIRDIQNGLPLAEGDIETTITLLRLSPQALGRSLRPIGMITEHRQGFQAAILPPEVDRMDRDYFLKTLCDLVQQDFGSRALSQYFYEVRSIRELELKGAHILKSISGIVVQQSYRQRQILGLLEGGRAVRMLAKDDMPEPWEDPPPLSTTPAPSEPTGH